MKSVALINNLQALPNWGCRSTGNALHELLEKNCVVTSRDGRETVLNSGWDRYSPRPYRIGKVFPARVLRAAWKLRETEPMIYHSIKSIESKLGGKHDYIEEDPDSSLRNFLEIKDHYPELLELEQQIRTSDAVVINGEGTLIIGSPTMRDALYALFVINLCKFLGKPVHLLNAMVTACPFNHPREIDLARASAMLGYCSRIACRESTSYNFVAGLVGRENLVQIPDALFSWGDKFRSAAQAIRDNPGMCLPFGGELRESELDFKSPYVCVSASSSAHRFGNAPMDALGLLVESLLDEGYRVYLVQTCDGDYPLKAISRSTGVPLIPQEVPVLAGGGILAGAAAYITGRYHPAIMAAAGGVPTIFMSSNSHKTRSVQELLGYEHPVEFPIAATPGQIGEMLSLLKETLSNRATLSTTILENHAKRASEALAYESII